MCAQVSHLGGMPFAAYLRVNEGVFRRWVNSFSCRNDPI
jgi:hypothetical protein